jgi:hypothetical protein
VWLGFNGSHFCFYFNVFQPMCCDVSLQVFIQICLCIVSKRLQSLAVEVKSVPLCFVIQWTVSSSFIKFSVPRYFFLSSLFQNSNLQQLVVCHFCHLLLFPKSPLIC